MRTAAPSINGLNIRLHISIWLAMTALLTAVSLTAFAMPDTGTYEGRPVASVELAFENSAEDPSSESELRSLIHLASGDDYSAVSVHDSLLDLFNSGLVASARVEVTPASPASPQGPVRVKFIIKRQLRIGAVHTDIVGGLYPAISVNELRGRLNLLQPGAKASEQAIRSNADLIQAYLRDKGFFGAEVEYSQQPDSSSANGTRVIVTYRITPNQQARVGAFDIKIKGFDDSRIRPQLKLQNGAPFSRSTLGEDISTIRQAIINQGYLAPEIEEPKTTLDSSTNSMAIAVTGSVGPHVTVNVKNYDLKEKDQRQLIPVLREGTIDISAIVEGERRLRNKLQEEGYFFADVNAVCTVTPPAESTVNNGTRETCENLILSDLSGRTVNITYDAERGRRFKLTDIRIEGTDKLTYADVANDLRTQKANVFGSLPLLGGYGRGYTSADLIEQDRRLIQSRMQDLGYRKAQVTARQGVSLTGDSLIITFVVEEGPLTRIAGIDVRGNKLYTAKELVDTIQKAGKDRCRNRSDDKFCFSTQIGGPFSRSQARADGDAVLNRYAQNGYLDAQLDFSSVDLPPKSGDEQVRLVYTVRNEGDKVFINNIIINGLVRTKPEAVRRAIPMKAGDILRADRLSESERILYATDAFRQVVIHTEPAGETSGGFKQRDVIIDVEEQKVHIMNYGGGFSTDYGPLGTFDIRNVNLFGKMQQGALRLRASGLQQLARVEYTDPRFKPYGNNQFSPFTLSLQYQQNSTVTRFFRNSIDQGANGVVQRFNDKGEPINQFGETVGEPTVNSLTFNIETQRTLNEKTRSLFFLRYTYDDVRLRNIGSLLVANLLLPDQHVRLSKLGATYVRDTRDNQFDTTRGDYFTVDYSLALRQLGGNISFNKLQLNYRRYYRVEKLRRTVFAGNLTLGLAKLFNVRDRDGVPGIDEADLRLPISERFFSGGSTTLRGFRYEEAGPRQAEPVCTPLNAQTCFNNFSNIFDQNGKPVTVDPFTVPIGGNALAVVNLEARVPLTQLFQIIPFYDGGNVFRTVGDLFGHKRPDVDPNLIAHWSHSVGLGFGVKTPLGGTLSVDFGYLLNPPSFIIPQANGGTAIFRLQPGRIHFRFTRAF
jgi:outer membrane protein insertion porin family